MKSKTKPPNLMSAVKKICGNVFKSGFELQRYMDWVVANLTKEVISETPKETSALSEGRKGAEYNEDTESFPSPSEKVLL